MALVVWGAPLALVVEVVPVASITVAATVRVPPLYLPIVLLLEILALRVRVVVVVVTV